jgi:hypothetical protein
MLGEVKKGEKRNKDKDTFYCRVGYEGPEGQ